MWYVVFWYDISNKKRKTRFFCDYDNNVELEFTLQKDDCAEIIGYYVEG